jgi:hypothetical protein
MKIFSDSPLGQACNQAVAYGAPTAFFMGIGAIFVGVNAITFLAPITIGIAAGFVSYAYETGEEVPTYVKKGGQAPALKR